MKTEIALLPGAAPGSGSARGVTIEDVKSAVEKLEAAGAPVNTRSVHAEVGRGSRSTICKHYSAIQLTRKAAEPNDSPPLSPIVLRELAREMERLVKERTSQLSAELTDVRASLELVVDENEAFRTAADESDSRVAALQVSLAEQSGIAEALRCQGASLSKQLEEVNSEAESARQALALAREHLRASEERGARMEAQEERVRSELADARHEGVELRAHLEAKTRECVTLQAQADSRGQLEGRLERAEAKVDALHVDLEATRSRFASSEALRSGLAERLKDAQDALSRAEATSQQLLHKVLESAPALHEGETK